MSTTHKKPAPLMAGTRAYGRGAAAFHAAREFDPVAGFVSCCGQVIVDLVPAAKVSVKARCRAKVCQAAFRSADAARS